jgi:hypothetical protein
MDNPAAAGFWLSPQQKHVWSLQQSYGFTPIRLFEPHRRLSSRGNNSGCSPTPGKPARNFADYFRWAARNGVPFSGHSRKCGPVLRVD